MQRENISMVGAEIVMLNRPVIDNKHNTKEIVPKTLNNFVKKFITLDVLYK